MRGNFRACGGHLSSFPDLDGKGATSLWVPVGLSLCDNETMASVVCL